MESPSTAQAAVVVHAHGGTWHSHPMPDLPDAPGLTTPTRRPEPPELGGSRAVELVAGGTHPEDVARLLSALRARVEGVGVAGRPLLVPIGPGEDPWQVRSDLAARLGPVPATADLILRTSGSTTGTGSLVATSVGALLASARATHARLGGPGTWVLALPAHHVAGLQILVRSLVAGTVPEIVDTSAGFSPSRLADAVQRARRRGPRVHVSLVPTQLVRALRDDRTTRLLACASAVLVGGAAADASLLARAHSAGIRVVTTYGMSETGGGCVYDGLPLDGVEVGIEDPDEAGVGRISLAGAVLAEGYVQRVSAVPSAGGEAVLTDSAAPPVATFTWCPTPDGGERRVLLTADRGRLGAEGRLHVLGRLDDLIVTGGVKVSPREVEEVLVALPGVSEACVVAVPDPQWGSAVVAVVVTEPDVALTPETIRAEARTRLDGPHTPKRVLIVDHLPSRGPGKVDRRSVADLAASTWHAHTFSDSPESAR